IEVRQVSCQDFAIKICEGRHRFSCDKNREQLRILPFDTMSRLMVKKLPSVRASRYVKKWADRSASEGTGLQPSFTHREAFRSSQPHLMQPSCRVPLQQSFWQMS